MLETCPSCNSKIDQDDIFCANCGTDIKSIRLINSQKDKQSEIKTDSNLNLSSDVIDLYENLESDIQSLTEIPSVLDSNKEQMNFMADELENKKRNLNKLEAQLKYEKQDVDKLKNLSFSSVFARIKGNRDQRIEKEEKEYFDLLNRIEALKVELDAQQKAYIQQIETVRDLADLNSKLQSKIKEQTQLVHKVTEGVPDPVEDAIEEEIRTLTAKIQPINQQYQSVLRAKNFISHAIRDLDQAYDALNSASSYSDWDTFFGGGMFADSVKHSRMSDARNAVSRARQNLDYAKQEYKHIPSVGNIHIEEISFFWDGFMDNIFSDFSARGKIHRSRDSVYRALNETQQVQRVLTSELQRLDIELTRLNDSLSLNKSKLLKERKRMIKEAIAKKN